MSETCKACGEVIDDNDPDVKHYAVGGPKGKGAYHKRCLPPPKTGPTYEEKRIQDIAQLARMLRQSEANKRRP